MATVPNKADPSDTVDPTLEPVNRNVADASTATPEFVGEYVLDTGNNKTYKAVGLNSGDFAEASIVSV